MVIWVISHRVAVMYRGEIAEQGGADMVTSQPKYSYSQRLLFAAPILDPIEQTKWRLRRSMLVSVANQEFKR